MTDRKEKFTPGPWKRALNMSRSGTGKVRGKSISRVVDSAGGVVAFMRPRKRQVANLLLIAAAPEMYEALKDLMSAMDDVIANGANIPDCIMYVVGEAQEKAKMAMKKARGEE